MEIKLKFLGATQNVTGSRYVVEANGARILVDCGLYQERDLRVRNWDPFPVSPSCLDAVLLTHAHLDHCGYLPKLVREGFGGKIFCTPATSELAEIVLLDAAKLQEEDAEFKQNRHAKESRVAPHPEVPLYTVQDAQNALPLFSTVDYGEPLELGDGIQATFHDAGHILGSSMIKLAVRRNGQARTILFSGDVGRWDRPILRDPTLFDQADYVLVESTYGDRLHANDLDTLRELEEVINHARKAGGNIVIPSFAIERSQEVLYRLNELLLEDRISHLMVFMDSPMAIRVTEVFERHPELHDQEMADLVRQNHSPFDYPGLKLIRTVDESKAIHHIRGTVAIIAGSGMCTGGRIKHHLAHNISRSQSTVLFVGYQAVGTLGRRIVDGAKTVRILGTMYPVRARVAKLGGFSAHADRDELLRWLAGLVKPPTRVFVTHGEPEAAQAFAGLLKERHSWPISVPTYREEALLD